MATGPLVDYVYRPDSNYEWSVYSRTPQQGFTTVYLSMTSQQWFDGMLICFVLQNLKQIPGIELYRFFFLIFCTANRLFCNPEKMLEVCA